LTAAVSAASIVVVMHPYPELVDAVANGNRRETVRLTQALLAAGTRPELVLDGGLVPGMAVVGDRFKRNEVFVPEMLTAARAMKEALQLLEPLLAKAGVTPKFTAVIGTVQGDLHDIGKNLVAMMWRGANIHTVDLGTNVSPDRFIQAVAEHKPRLIGLSALLTTTMPAMRTTVARLRASGLTGYRILIGGAPVTEEFAREIGADGFAPDAGSAVDAAQALIGAH